MEGDRDGRGGFDNLKLIPQKGKTIKQIARETGHSHSRNTIKRILRGKYIGYRAREHQPYPVLGPHIEAVDRWLPDDKNQRKKQRHAAVRVFHRLLPAEIIIGRFNPNYPRQRTPISRECPFSANINKPC